MGAGGQKELREPLMVSLCTGAGPQLCVLPMAESNRSELTHGLPPPLPSAGTVGYILICASVSPPEKWGY